MRAIRIPCRGIFNRRTTNFLRLRYCFLERELSRASASAFLKKSKVDIHARQIFRCKKFPNELIFFPWQPAGCHDFIMSRPRISGQRFHRRYQARTHRIQVYIPDQLQQITLRVDHGRFISILKKMTHPLIFSIEVERVSRHQAPHEIGKIPCSAVIKKVEVIRHESPCQTTSVEADYIAENPSAHFLPVVPIQKDVPFLDSPCVHMMKRAWEIDTRSPCHTGKGSNEHAI